MESENRNQKQELLSKAPLEPQTIGIAVDSHGTCICLCGETFVNYISRGLHQIHIHNAKFQCGNCSMRFLSSESLEKHGNCDPRYARSQGGNSKGRFRCHCGQRFHEKVGRGIHQVLDHDAFFICEECQAVFTASELLLSHQRIEQHSRHDYWCGCGLVFNSSSDLKYHRAEEHGATFECEICEVTYPTAHDLKCHQIAKQHGHYALENPDALRYVCRCGERFTTDYDLGSHQRYIHNETFSCPVCQKFCKSSEDLAKHQINDEHGHVDPATRAKFAYKCNVCQILYASSASLKSHKRDFGHYVTETDDQGENITHQSNNLGHDNITKNARMHTPPGNGAYSSNGDYKVEKQNLDISQDQVAVFKSSNPLNSIIKTTRAPRPRSVTAKCEILSKAQIEDNEVKFGGSTGRDDTTYHHRIDEKTLVNADVIESEGTHTKRKKRKHISEDIGEPHKMPKNKRKRTDKSLEEVFDETVESEVETTKKGSIGKKEMYKARLQEAKKALKTMKEQREARRDKNKSEISTLKRHNQNLLSLLAANV